MEGDLRGREERQVKNLKCKREVRSRRHPLYTIRLYKTRKGVTEARTVTDRDKEVTLSLSFSQPGFSLVSDEATGAIILLPVTSDFD